MSFKYNTNFTKTLYEEKNKREEFVLLLHVLFHSHLNNWLSHNFLHHSYASKVEPYAWVPCKWMVLAKEHFETSNVAKFCNKSIIWESSTVMWLVRFFVPCTYYCKVALWWGCVAMNFLICFIIIMILRISCIVQGGGATKKKCIWTEMSTNLLKF